MKKLKQLIRIVLTTLLALIVGVNQAAETNELSKDQLNQLHADIYNRVTKEIYIRTNRVTKGGVLDMCELEFQNAYRDYRALKDGIAQTIFVMGSFAIMYIKEKQTIGTFLKIVPASIDVLNQRWDRLYPPYTDIVISGESLQKFKITDSQCEAGGKCSGYHDKEFKILELVLSSQPFHGEIKLSLVEGGMDTAFELSSLSPDEVSLEERKKFTSCVFELMDLFISDLEIQLRNQSDKPRQ